MTIHKFTTYKNKDTGLTAYKIALVRNIEGLFYGVYESDYGMGDGVSQKKVSKGFKSEKVAQKNLDKWVDSLPKAASYERMASSHWRS